MRKINYFAVLKQVSQLRKPSRVELLLFTSHFMPLRIIITYMNFKFTPSLITDQT